MVSRQNCHLCDVAEQEIARICGELGVAWSVTDVDSDPGLRADYGDMVPVILIDGVQHGYWRVEEERLRAALAVSRS